jgi:hypothetical protein
MRGIYEAAVEVGTGAMICIPNIIKIGSGIQKSIEEATQIHRHTESMVTEYAHFYFSK